MSPITHSSQAVQHAGWRRERSGTRISRFSCSRWCKNIRKAAAKCGFSKVEHLEIEREGEINLRISKVFACIEAIRLLSRVVTNGKSLVLTWTRRLFCLHLFVNATLRKQERKLTLKCSTAIFCFSRPVSSDFRVAPQFHFTCVHFEAYT